MTNPTPNERVWDETLALSNADGCLEDLKELVEIWLRQTPYLLSDLKSGLKNNDPDKIHFAAHTLKGSLQILGSVAAVSAAEAMEIAGPIDLVRDGQDLFNALEKEIDLITPQITAFLIRHTAP